MSPTTSRCLALVFWALVLAPTGGLQAKPLASQEAYRLARQGLRLFNADPARQRYRDPYIKILADLAAISTRYPQSPEAPLALFVEAGLWARLQAVSHRVSDGHQALVAYERLEKVYPAHALADDALWERAQLLLQWHGDKKAAAQQVSKLLQRYPQGDMAPRARLLQKQLPKVTPEPDASDDTPGLSAPKLFGRRDEARPAPQVRSVRHWSNPVYTRVVLYLSEPAEARLGELDEDKKSNTPARIFLDIAGASLAPAIKPERVINDELLQRVRIAQRADDKVRVVLDLKKNVRPRVLVMENPYRLVIDAMVPDDADAPVAQLTRRRRVVIDPGHGGHDSGALGPSRAQEKDVVLAISKQVQQLLDASGTEAVLTRSHDIFVSLEERTAIANRLGADAFVSIHANSAPNKKARGIETYYLNVTSDRYAIRLAAVENKTSVEQVSDLQLILADLSTKANSQESAGLARRVQKKMVAYAQPLNPLCRDLGVKASLFYVLLGARMPSILVETSFISNAEEAKLLTDVTYQRRLAKAVADAITEHLNTPLRIVGP